MTTSSIFLKDENLYLINFNKKSLESLNQYNQYNLIISDKYFFYLSMEIPPKSKNIRDIIWNYLKTQFHEDIIPHFDYILYQENKIIIFIFNEELKNFIENNESILKRAQSISTPFLELTAKKERFLYKTEEIIYDFNNGTIELSFTPNTKPISEKEVIFTLDKLQNNIEFTFLRKKFFNKKDLISLIAIFIISYTMFIGGNIFKLKATSLIYKKYNNILNNIYQQNGITNTLDPYGELLYKASKISNKAKKINISKILYNFSISCPPNCTINSLIYRHRSIICYGYTTKLATIDKFRTNLQKYFSSIEVTNTLKQNSKVTFSLKCKL